jgi:hypothetical protein
MQISPANFLTKYSQGGHSIQYSDFTEITEGGPEVGLVSIDGKSLGPKGNYFGGPPVFFKNYLFIPQLMKSPSRRYFRLSVVDLSDCSIKEIGENEELILLSKVNDNSVFFFKDIPNGKLNSIRWN